MKFSDFSPTKKFYILSFASLLLVGIIFFFFFTSVLKSYYLDQNVELVSDLVQTKAMQSLQPQDFETTDYATAEQHFSSFFDELSINKGLIRIKVWSKDATIVFSNTREIIGQSYPENREFQKAILGELSSEIKPPEKPEHVSEKGYAQLMEIYIPIKLGGDQAPAGVIEAYYSLDRVNTALDSLKLQLIILIAIAILITFLALNFVFKEATSTISTQGSEIQRYSRELEAKVRELTKSKKELEKTVATLEKTNKIMVGRELRMAELKEKFKK